MDGIAGEESSRGKSVETNETKLPSRPPNGTCNFVKLIFLF